MERAYPNPYPHLCAYHAAHYAANPAAAPANVYMRPNFYGEYPVGGEQQTCYYVLCRLSFFIAESSSSCGSCESSGLSSLAC